MTDDGIRCRCCRQTWAPESFGMVRGKNGVEYRRGRCRACQYNCVPGSRPARNRAYRARLRADVEAIRSHLASVRAA